MKLLDIDGFAALNALLVSGVKGPSCTVAGRLEAYSCKRVREDKKIARIIQDRGVKSPANPPAQETSPLIQDFDGNSGSFSLTPLALQPSLPSNAHLGTSHQDTDAVVDIVTTLNLTFPDHTFTDLPSEVFFREQPEAIQRTVSLVFAETAQYLNQIGAPDLEPSIWREIDQVVNLSQCEFFAFRPDSSASPVEGATWEHYYFFLNRAPEVNKLVFLTLHAAPNSPGDDDMALDDELGVSESATYSLHYGVTDPMISDEDADLTRSPHGYSPIPTQ
eukprot:TRINITY_DN21608_c0_g1_i1.p1 TRINITY_DN21608_c0_g1~~TRINITY_DN21608_c0_g1_i1.p1  ORF type:complete len:276 (+),score=32.60 TRINITY_DN21608_c0_g1_i1:258-1085(+)